MRIVIAGGGPAAVESAIAARKADPSAEIDIYSAENFLPYRRPALSGLLACGKAIDEKTFYIKTPDFFAAENIGFHPGSKVTAVDGRSIVLGSGEKADFDKLILACGSQAVRLPIPGAERAFLLRDLPDMTRLAAVLEPAASAVVIGGGVLGLEIADSLLTRQIKTTVCEVADQLFPGRISPDDAAELLAKVNAIDGLQVLCGKCVTQIGEKTVTLSDGTILPADVVIMAAGSRPDLTLAKTAGLECGRGVKVNEFMQSSDPDILAAGDMAEFNGRCFNLYMDAMASGKIAGAYAAGAAVNGFAAKFAPTRLMALGLKLTL